MDTLRYLTCPKFVPVPLVPPPNLWVPVGALARVLPGPLPGTCPLVPDEAASWLGGASKGPSCGKESGDSRTAHASGWLWIAASEESIQNAG